MEEFKGEEMMIVRSMKNWIMKMEMMNMIWNMKKIGGM